MNAETARKDLKTLFDQYFEVVLATTPELKKEVFRTRYQVYCEEGLVPDFEPWKFPDGMERDEHDAHSLHSLLYHRTSRKIAGTVRLVFCDPKRPQTMLPIEEHGGRQLLQYAKGREALQREQVAEISRLLLTKEFRSRRGEDLNPYGFNNSETNLTPNERRQFPHSVLGLLVAITQMSGQNGISHWYAAMEPGLNRMLRFFSVDLQQAGPIIDYHGRRVPYFSDAYEVLAKAYHENRAIWDLLTSYGADWSPPDQSSTIMTGHRITKP